MLNPIDGETAPLEALQASIIVFDQFSRNMFRGTAKAFATDFLALNLARAAMKRGLDKALDEEQRLFLYLPFMHSETITDQELSLALFSGDRYAIDHHAIILRFGRFPHRNKVLERESTQEELEYLQTAERFGQ